MLGFVFRSFATKAAAGVTKNTKDSAGRRLGIKKFGGEEVGYNKIIVRQRGFKWHPGYNVHVGKDHTLHSSVEGVVLHEYDEKRCKTVVSVVPWKIPERPKLKKVFCYHPEVFPEKAKNNPAPGNFFIKPKVEKPAKVVREKGIALAVRKYS
jgi:large subunit ribosomal protein L27